MSRTYGFATTETSDEFLPKKGKISEEDKARLFSQAEEELVRIYEELQAGRIEPQPEDERLCSTCDWNQLCRNPSLNL
jgi:hypothetical protein